MRRVLLRIVRGLTQLTATRAPCNGGFDRWRRTTAVPLLTTAEASKYLGRTPAFVRSLCAQGLVRHVVVSGRYYVKPEWLDAIGEESCDTLRAALPRRLGGRPRRR